MAISPSEFLNNPNLKTDPTTVPPINQKGTSFSDVLNNPGVSDLLNKGKTSLKGFGDSNFLQNLTTESNPKAVMAANQGFWDELGNGLAQLASSAGLGSIESFGYTPGLSSLINKIGGSNQEFGNVLSDWARKTNEKFGKEIVPVYNNPETKDISEWTFENIGSLGTTVGLLLPVLGEMKAVGATAKALGGYNILKKGLATVNGVQEGSQAFNAVLGGLDTIGSAVLSRHMEGMMEGKEQYDKVYEESLAKGFSEDHSKKAANEAAQNTYNRNWPLVAIDMLQFGIAFKSFKNLSRASNDLERKALQKTLGDKIGSSLIQPGSEAFEEGYQYIAGQEASRQAKIKYGIDKEDFSTFPERFKDYLAGQHSDEFWTSAFWGAAGGKLFEATTDLANRPNEKKAEALQSQIKSLLKQQTSVYEKDPIKFAKASDEVIFTQIINAIENHRADDIKNTYEVLKDTKLEGHTEEEMKELRDRAEFGLSQLKELSEFYDNVASKNTADITKYMMLNKANNTLLSKVTNSLDEAHIKHVQELSKDNNLDASYSKLLEAETSLKTLTELKNQKNLSINADIIANREKLLSETISQYRETIKTNNQISDKDIDDKLNKVNKSQLATLSYTKNLFNLHKDQNAADLAKINTPKGKEELQEEITKQKQKNKDIELANVVSGITSDKSATDIQVLREQAKGLGKEKEFTSAYNTKLAQDKLQAPRIDTNDIASSLKRRWENNTLLKDHELNNMSQMILKSGGLPEGGTLDEDTISAMYNNNQTFRKKFDEYSKNVGGIIPTTKKNVTQQPTSTVNEDVNKKEKEEQEKSKEEQTPRNNHHAWLSQGYQFEYNKETRQFDLTKPNVNNLSSKIDWKYLNSGSIPIGAILNYEIDFSDSFNKGKNPYNSLIEIVHYDEKNNRHVLGALTAYDEIRVYESSEDKIKLRNLREQLWNTAFDMRVSGEVARITKPLGIKKVGTTKLKKYLSSNPWNVTQYNAPLDVLKPEEELVLAVATSENNIPVLNFNGHPLKDKVAPLKAGTPGAVYMIIQNPATKEYYPYKLFTQKLSTKPDLVEYVEGVIKKVQTGEVTKEEALDDISDIVYIQDIQFQDGNYTLTLGSVKDPSVILIKEADLKQILGNLVMQIDITKINKDYNGESYNKQLSKQGFISTDLNPNEHFHSTNIAIESFSQPKFEGGELKTSGTPLPTPNIVTSQSSTIKTNREDFPEIQENTRTAVTKKLLDIIAEVEEIEKFNGDLQKGDYLLWLDKTPSNLGIEVGQLLNSPRRAFDLIQKTIQERGLTLKIVNKSKPQVIKNIGTTKLNLGEPKYAVRYSIEDGHHLNENEVREWFNKRLPQVSLEVRNDLVGSLTNADDEILGLFIDGAVTLYKGSNNRIAYHEGFHAAFNMFLTEQQRQAIFNEAKTIWTNKDINNVDPNNETYITEEDKIEELLADEFARYVEQDYLSLGYNIRDFFRRLLNILREIFNKNINIESLYYNINAGNYKNAKDITLDSTKTNYSIRNVNPYIQNRRIGMINYQFFKALDELRNEYSLGDLSDLQVLQKINSNPKDSLQIVYGRVYNGLIEKYNEKPSEFLKDVIDNFFVIENGEVTGTGAYYGKAIQDLANFGIRVKENLDQEVELDEEQEQAFDFNEEELKQQSIAQKASFVDPKTNLSNEVRKNLRQLEKYKYDRESDSFSQEGLEDDLGFQSFVNFDEITNYLQKNIADIFDVDDMMNQLEELKYYRPEIYGLLNKLNENEQLKTQFFSNFSKVYIPYYMIQQMSVQSDITDEHGNPEQESRFTLFNANRKSINQLIVDDWNNNLISTFRNDITNSDGTIDKSKAEKYFKEYQGLLDTYRKFKEISDTLANEITTNLSKFGIVVDPQVLVNEFVARKVYENGKRVEYTPYQNLLNLLSGTQSFSTILSKVNIGENPYQGNTIESTSLRKVTGVVARTQENLHQDTIINGDGNQLYSYISPTFLHKKIQELKTEKGRELYNQNWWFSKNKWLQDLSNIENQELRDWFEVIVLNNLKLDGRDAVEFSSMNAKELAITDINLYDHNGSKDYAIYRTPIITGSSLAPAIRFKKYSKADIVDAFYQLALAEQQRIQNITTLDIPVKNLSKNGNQFQFVDIFNTKSELLENESQAKEVIESWLDQHMLEERQRLTYEEVLSPNGSFNNTIDARRYKSNFKDYQTKFQEYYYNVALAKAMILQLTSVDISFYKNSNDFQKRAGQVLKPTKMINPQASYNGTITGETYKSIYLIDEVVDGSEITDSQTYITVARRRKIAIGLGEWNENNEKIYQKLVNNKASDDEGTFSPLKPFYYNHETLGSWILPVQHKNSEVTLTKNFTKKNPKLDKLRDYMVANGIDSAIYVSAVKAGEYGAVKIEDLGKEIQHTFQNKYWGIQTEIPNHYLDQTILFGTQAKKLIMVDIAEDAKFFNGTMNKKEFYDIYQKLITDNIIESYNDVEKEFLDINKIQKILLEEVNDRNLGDSYRKALELRIDSQGNKVFNIPLFDPIFGKRMQNILNSIIRNAVTRQKINGGSFVLASSAGIVKPKTSDALKIVRDKDGNIQYMEVMLPAWMKNLFPRLPNGEIDIEALKDEAPDLLKGFGYFIPTEGKKSMMSLNVVGFLPDLEGGIAIFPGELIGISGKDFDKDEVYIMLPNAEVKDGKLQKIKYNLNNLNKVETKEEYSWARYSNNNYEVSSQGDKRFSALIAKLNDGRTIEEAYQLDIKGYRIKGNDWHLGKGKPSLRSISQEQSWEEYKQLWRTYLDENPDLLKDLQDKAKGKVLTDKFASTKVSQARALSEILNEINPKQEQSLLNKQQRDNAIIDIMREAWSHPENTDQIQTPSNFDTLKALREELNEKLGVDINANPILPQSDAAFFERSANGGSLLPIAAVNNTAHANFQHTNVKLTSQIGFDGKKSSDLNLLETLDGEALVSDDLSQYLAAFADNDKEPVAGFLNLNEYTINVAITINSVGFRIPTAIYFLNQPILQRLVKGFNKLGGSKKAEIDAKDALVKKLISIIGEDIQKGSYMLRTSDLRNQITDTPIEKLTKDEAKEQLKVLYTFEKYKELADSLSNLVRATRSDTLGTGKTMADNGFYLNSIDKALKDDNLENQNEVFDLPIIKVSTQKGIAEPQKNLLSKYLPYDGALFQDIIDFASQQKQGSLTSKEVNYLYNQFIHYYVSGFSFFEAKEKPDFINKFPEHFNKIKANNKLNQFDLIKYLRYVPINETNKVPRIEFTSGATISNEQRELIKQSWEAMMVSDEQDVRKLALNLIKYSFFATNFGFTYSGFSHLIPPSFFENILDKEGNTYRDYMYKVMQEANSTVFTQPFLQQIYQNQDQKGGERLLSKISFKQITNRSNTKGNITASIMFNKEAFTKAKLAIVSEDLIDQLVVFIRVKNNNGKFYTYKYAGFTSDGNLVYNVLPNLGYENHITEFDKTNRSVESVLPVNQLPKFEEKDYFTNVTKDDEFYQLEQEEKNKKQQKADAELNSILRQFASSLGIKIEYVNDLKTRTGQDALGIAKIFDKLIQISQGKDNVNTLPEEVGHFTEAYTRGSGYHDTLMNLVSGTQAYQEVLAEYGDLYKNDIDKLKQETIGKLIGEAIIKKNEQYRKGPIFIFLKGLWDKFLSIFKRASAYDLQSEVNTITEYIASQILDNKTDIFKQSNKIKIGDEFYQLVDDNDINETEEAIKTAIDSIYKKIKLYERTGTNEFTQAQNNVLEKLQKDFAQKNYELGLIRYLANARIELKKVATRYSNMKSSNPQGIEEQRELINQLKAANNYVEGFKLTLDKIAEITPFSKSVNEKAGYTAKLVDKLEKDYLKIGKELLSNVLKEFSTNPNLNIKDALNILEGDISFTQRWLDALAETSDPILGILDKLVKDYKEIGRKKTIEEAKDLTDAQKALEKAGIKSTQFMYERDFQGNLTGRYVTEYNVGEYQKQKKEFFKENPYPQGESYIGRPNELKTDRLEWNKKVAKWFEENTQPHPSRKKIIEEKQDYFSKEYKNPVVAKQKYEEWINQNVREIYGFDEFGETTDYQYRGELQIPSEKYKSEVYKDIQNTPALKAYYDKAKNLLEKKDEQLPEIYKLKGLMPQQRKDFYERLYFVDKDGKKKLRNPSDLSKELRVSIAEAFTRNENDTEFGLTDESGKPINFIPVYFTRKLDNMSNLSVDATSTIIAFSSSANDFEQISKVLGTIELSKDILAEREILTGKFDPVTLFNKKDKKGKPITSSGKESHAYKRYEDYINMVIYGQQQKSEKIKGYDVAKIIDQINRYTALNSLAGNIYSGISNITLGSALERTEAIAGEFYDNKDLLEADKIYTSELVGTIEDIGQRQDSSKLNLWIEHMNTLQNYNRDFRDLDAGRDTVFSRLMKESSLFFLNHVGEHYMQTRLSLALAQRTKVKDSTGKEISLWEAFDKVNVGTSTFPSYRLKMKEGITKVGSDEYGSLFKKSEDDKSLTEKDINRFINRQNFLNKRLHGIYNDVDKSAIQQYALGRMAIMFRKFIKPGWNRRFAKLTYNEEGEIYTEGNYNTTFRFMKGLAKDLAQAKFSLIKNFDNLNQGEKANVLRSLTEVAYMIAAVTLGAVLSNLADDDEDNWALNLAAYEAYRLYSELRFFSSINEFQRILKSPSATVYQFDKINRFLQVWNWSDEYKRGKYEGLTHFERGLVELTPLIGTYYNFRTPEEQLRFYTNQGVTIF